MSDDSELDEARLIELMAVGKKVAFDELWKAIKGHIWTITGNPRVLHGLSFQLDAREDCAQHIAQKLFETGIDGYLQASKDNTIPLKKWLWVFAYHAAIDFRRNHPEYRRYRRRGELAWYKLVEDPHAESHLDDDDPELSIQQAEQAVKILLWARDNIDPQQFESLIRWIYGVDPKQTNSTRAALRKLRDRFK